MIRLNTNGSPDSSFDGDGKITTALGTSTASLTEVINAIAIQSDGKIVVAGHALVGYPQFALARYNPDGSLDASFDGDGKVITMVGSGRINAMVIQSDGKIVVGGGGSAFALARYNTDGSLDLSFDSDGKVTTSMGLSPSVLTSLAIQFNGKI